MQIFINLWHLLMWAVFKSEETYVRTLKHFKALMHTLNVRTWDILISLNKYLYPLKTNFNYN